MFVFRRAAPQSPGLPLLQRLVPVLGERKKTTFREVIGTTPRCQQTAGLRTSNTAKGPLKGTVDTWPCPLLFDGPPCRQAQSLPGPSLPGHSAQKRNFPGREPEFLWLQKENTRAARGLTCLPLRSQREAWALDNSSKRPHIMSSALTLQQGLSAHLVRAPLPGRGLLDLVSGRG